MKLALSLYTAFVAFTSVLAISAGAPAEDAPSAPIFERVPVQELWKRRGGGGSGGRGGGGSSGGGSSGGRGSSSSSSGGRTTTGSGVRPSYGGGTYYGGGATVPYRSGAASPSGITPFLFGAGAATLLFWPGLWLNGAYLYHYSHPYVYHNATTNKNETKPVICGCDTYEECGCDDNNNATYVNSILGNGSYAALNQSVVTVADVNGTSTILINGTLPNGTTAAGGTEDPNAGEGMRALLNAAGWWPVVATVIAAVFAL